MKRRKTIKQRLERVVPGRGRVSVRTGARAAAEHKARIALFDRLLEAGQLEAIYLLLDKKLTWVELRQAQRKNRLQSDTLAADIAITRGLWSAMAATLPKMGRSGSTRDRYDLAFSQLQDKGADFLPPGAMVADLKSVPWGELFALMHNLSPASRNRVRSALSAFLTVFLGDKFHPFRREVMKAVGGMEDEATPPKEITLEEFWTNLNATDEAIRPIILTLAGSGLRIGELLQCNEVSAKRLPLIYIPGGKTGSGEASISPELLPFARQAIPCNIAPRPKVWRGVQNDARYRRIYKAMRKASDATQIPWGPHYLRHLYAQIATDNLSAVLAQQGLRHATSSMTEKYAKRKTTKQVAAVVGSALMGSGKVRRKVRASVSRRAI